LKSLTKKKTHLSDFKAGALWAANLKKWWPPYQTTGVDAYKSFIYEELRKLR
jgi:hypothetical protein